MRRLHSTRAHFLEAAHDHHDHHHRANGLISSHSTSSSTSSSSSSSSSSSTISSCSSSTSTATTSTLTSYASYFPSIVKPSVPALRIHSPAREDSTRVQLQRQRFEEQHPRTFVTTAHIPGLQTSFAFFASLRTNLRLHASPPSSPIPATNSWCGSITSLPPPSPLSVPWSIMGDDVPDASIAEDPLAGVPELESHVATDEVERVEALRLVADSVAQQRQTANRAIISHPLNVSTFVVLVAIMWQYMQNLGYDTAIIGTTAFGLLMAGLVSCRYWTQGYLYAAEKINWEWTGDVDILVTKFGDELIGAVLVEWISGESRKKSKKAWRGVVKAWTVKQKYRGKGVGTALLEDAVREAKKKGAESLEFADDHANSTRVLPRIYNGKMDKRDRRARAALQDLFEASPSRGGKKKP